MADKKIIAVVGATGAQGGGLGWAALPHEQLEGELRGRLGAGGLEGRELRLRHGGRVVPARGLHDVGGGCGRAQAADQR